MRILLLVMLDAPATFGLLFSLLIIPFRLVHVCLAQIHPVRLGMVHIQLNLLHPGAMPVTQLLPFDQELALCVLRNSLPSSSLSLFQILSLLDLLLLFLVFHPFPSPGENLLNFAFKRLTGAPWTCPAVLRHLVQWRINTSEMVAVDAAVTAKQLTTLFASPAELHVLVIIVIILNNGRTVLFAMRATPFSLRGFVVFIMMSLRELRRSY